MAKKKIGRLLFFWVGFPLSLPALLLTWIIYFFSTDYIGVDDLGSAIKHFYLGIDDPDYED